MTDYQPIYDFNETESKYKWENFTDQVMGGVSEISTRLMNEDNQNFIRMEGDVSLKNNGGFIQIRLELATGFKVFKASDFDGIRLYARGQGSGYYLFLRTSNTFFPWQFFKASVNTGDDWRTIDIPWNEIVKGDNGTLGNFDPAKLKSIALVAYGKEFRAEVDLMRIGFYKK